MTAPATGSGDDLPPPPPPAFPAGPGAYPASGVAEPPLADLGSRLGAVLLDWLVGGVVFYVPVVAAAFVGSALSFGGGVWDVLGNIVMAAGTVVGLVLTALFTFVAEGRTGQTYGKHVVGISALRDGRPIGSVAAFGRYLVKGFGLSVFGLGWLWALWDERRQGWHDKVVATVVVETPGPTLSPVAFLGRVWTARA